MSNHPQKSGSLCSGMSGSLCSGIGGSLYSGMSGSLYSGIGGSLYPGIGGSLYPGILRLHDSCHGSTPVPIKIPPGMAQERTTGSIYPQITGSRNK